MRKTLFWGLFVSANIAHAGSAGVNPGSSMTLGPLSSHYSIHAGLNNPAMPSLMLPEEENWRYNYFPTIALNYEIGDVDNFADDLDELIDIIDDPNSTDDSAEEVLDRFNDVLRRTGEDGYGKITASLDFPLLPFVHKSDWFDGSFAIGLNVTAQAGLRVLDDELSFNDQNGTFSTASSLYTKGGVETTLSFSYSQEVMTNSAFTSEENKLYAGIKLKLINLELSKQVTPLEVLDNEDVSDYLRDEYDNNANTQLNLGIDLGLVWDTPFYRAGLTIENINSPEFDYGTVGENCARIAENTDSRTSCEAAAFFIQVKGDISANETHTKHAYVRADGLLKITERWLAGVALDLAEYEDIVGFDNQWLNLSTSYDPRNKWIPSLRLGYQQNMADKGTSSALVGFTFLRGLTLDFEWGLDSVEVDDSSAPRRVGFSIGYSEQF